jgi:hypothetical protein
MTIWKKKIKDGTQVIFTLSFKGKHQTPLIMVIKEYHTIIDEVTWASIIWSK